MIKGTLKEKRRKSRIKKRCIVLSGVSMFAAIVCIPAFATENTSVPTKVVTSNSDTVGVSSHEYATPADSVTAGISAHMYDILEDRLSKPAVEVTTVDKTIVTSAPLEDVTAEFKEFATVVKEWCLSNNQLSIDLIHSATIGETTSTILESHAQVDNSSKQSHVCTETPKYTLDMWYNVSNSDYYVNMVTGENSTNWVHLNNCQTKELDAFIKSHITYNTSPVTIQEVLAFIAEQGDIVISPGVSENSYTVTFETTDTSVMPVTPTFASDVADIERWGVLVQVIDSTVYVDVIYHYTPNASVEVEKYSYKISATDTCNIEYPAILNEQVGELNTLEEFYTSMKGN